MTRFKAPVAVVVLIEREHDGKRQLLLQRRRNTGFGDGMWDLACSGHVEEGESCSCACARECREELGIETSPEDFRFFALIYKRDGAVTYVNPYFALRAFAGEPCIAEPLKCSELRWFDENSLPDELLPDRKSACDAYRRGHAFIEYGMFDKN